MEETITVQEHIEELLDDISVNLADINEKLMLIRQLGVEDESLAEALNMSNEVESIVDTYITNN